MVRKIKKANNQINATVDGGQLNSNSYMKMLTEIKDIDKMNFFLNDIKSYEDDEIRDMDIDSLFKMLPSSVKKHFMNLISGSGIGHLTDKQKSIFISQNYNTIKNMLVDMIISLKNETPETVQMEKEFTESFKKYQTEYEKVKEIQYEFCKILRQQKIEHLKLSIKKNHDLKKKKELTKMLNVIQSIDTFDIIIEKAKPESPIIKMCIEENNLSHNSLLTIGTKATKLLLETLMEAPDNYHDPREFASIIFNKLFDKSQENMEIVTYFWIGYVNAITEGFINIAKRSFVLETSLNWLFLAKDEIPEKDKKEIKDNIIAVANKVKSIIDEARATRQ